MKAARPENTAANQADPETAARKAWLSVLAKADPAALAARWGDLAATPAYETLRAPEVGTVMVQGRAGAHGAPFNLGEMTITRASIRLDAGPVGHGYVQGRGKAHALTAALVDAMMQTDQAAAVASTVIAPLRRAGQAAKAARAAKAAATKVDFFTMPRGED